MLLAGVGVARAVGAGHDHAVPAAEAKSYCEAARDVAWFDGRSDARLHSLVEQALGLSPREVEPQLQAMLRSDRRSSEFARASAAFTTFNTNHCCECIGERGEPAVVAVGPARASASAP